MINIAVCDDDNYIASEVETLLLSISQSTYLKINVEVYYDGSTLEKAIVGGEKYDLIYLDIEMKQDGIVTAKRLRDLGVSTLIIYISGHDKYLRSLFEVGAISFLDKPINKELFSETFIRAVEKINKNEEIFAYRFNRITYRTVVKDIVYFESTLRILRIHHVNGQIREYYGALNVVEQYFEKIGIPFIRTHQSFLINYDYIYGCGKKEIELVNGIHLPISEERREKVQKQYTTLIGKGLFNE